MRLRKLVNDCLDMDNIVAYNDNVVPKFDALPTSESADHKDAATEVDNALANVSSLVAEIEGIVDEGPEMRHAIIGRYDKYTIKGKTLSRQHTTEKCAIGVSTGISPAVFTGCMTVRIKIF